MKKITFKNYSLGILYTMLLMIVLGWIGQGFRMSFFTNWQTLLLIIAVGLGFGLLLTPFFLFNLDAFKDKKKRNTKKLILVDVVIWLVFTIGLIAIDYLSGQNITARSVLSEAISNLIIIAFVTWI